jgi:hypothetical protein
VLPTWSKDGGDKQYWNLWFGMQRNKPSGYKYKEGNSTSSNITTKTFFFPQQYQIYILDWHIPYWWCNVHYSRVQLSDNSISLLLNQERFPDDAYVITSGDNIYHTNNTTNTVSCHKINGDKLWEFQDVAIIRDPRGVAVDRDLNVYVASNVERCSENQMELIIVSIFLEAMCMMLICWNIPFEIANLVSSIQVTS